MELLRVGVDCDNVLRDTRGIIVELARAQNPDREYRREDYDCLKTTDPVFIGVRAAFYQSPAARALCQPFPDALPAIQLLRLHDFVPNVVSVCDEGGRDTSFQWLRDEGFTPYLESVIFGSPSANAVDFKVSEAKALKMVTFFDDSAKIVSAVSEELGIPGYVIGSTDKLLPARVHCAETLLEAVQTFLRDFGGEHHAQPATDLPLTVN